MKKLMICLTVILSFVGVNKVNADTVEVPYSDILNISSSYYISDYDYLVELGYSYELQEVYNLLIEEYNTKYSSLYPYYYLSVVSSISQNDNIVSVNSIYIYLNLYEDIPSLSSWMFPDADLTLNSSYIVSSETYNLPFESAGISNLGLSLIYVSSSKTYYYPLAYFVSNFDLVYNGTDTYKVTGNDNFEISPGTTLQPVFYVEDAFQEDYLEINLNNYSYVALALKNYNQNAFTTNVQVKGQYCITPVYNYGMTERKDILSGTQVDRCSPYYEYYTPIRTYILDSDLKNHAIYYLKAYDTSKDNYVKIDTTVFDVTLITEENKDNPYITIQGKVYPTIPYNNLTDTATKSEDEGYVSGAVEEFSFSDIFTAPLDFLKDVWNSISLVFSLITELLSLLPPVMQNFLYASFMLAIVLGLIKIIL